MMRQENMWNPGDHDEETGKYIWNPSDHNDVTGKYIKSYSKKMIYLSTTPLEDRRHQCSSLNQVLSQHHSENSRRLDLHLFVIGVDFHEQALFSCTLCHIGEGLLLFAYRENQLRTWCCFCHHHHFENSSTCILDTLLCSWHPDTSQLMAEEGEWREAQNVGGWKWRKSPRKGRRWLNNLRSTCQPIYYVLHTIQPICHC